MRWLAADLAGFAMLWGIGLWHRYLYREDAMGRGAITNGSLFLFAWNLRLLRVWAVSDDKWQREGEVRGCSPLLVAGHSTSAEKEVLFCR